MIYISCRTYYQNYKFATTNHVDDNLHVNQYYLLVYIQGQVIYMLAIIDISHININNLYKYNHIGLGYSYFFDSFNNNWILLI